ncbi:DNA translocase FtsK [hydrothermal vent metagenome]|uniref:DNA translocase FtsK n=1 Tax=hydrothermal vent metagenome TaxID=652676 RepID=A0A3B0ZBV7_9ZZZZ
MAQGSLKGSDLNNDKTQSSRRMRESALFVVGAVALYLLVSLVSYSNSDPGWSHSRASGDVANLGGIVGAWFADLSLLLVGYLAYLVPVMVAFLAWVLFKGEVQQHQLDSRELSIRLFGFVLTLAAGSGLAVMHFTVGVDSMPLGAGGILGELVSTVLINAFSFLGATLFLLALFLTGVTLFTSLSWLWLMDVLGRFALDSMSWLRFKYSELRERLAARKMRKSREASVKVKIEKRKDKPEVRIESLIAPVKVSERVEKEKQAPLFNELMVTGGGLPALALLDDAQPPKHELSVASLEALSRLVEIKLADFGIEVEVVAVTPGPVITRFELQPAAGIKVSRITGLSKDLARALSTVSVRIVEVIAGKTTIGLEIPNEHREMVYLSETLQSEAYDKMSSPLTLALGKDINGQPVVADLAKMPHLLVAGTTGSGKSVAVNTMILSLLFKSTPDDVRLIMVDPKMLELSVYEGIPHLLAPVVTDMKEAANALRWCVAEMERRYKLMAKLGVRNISGANKKIKEAIAAGEPIADPTFKPALPDVPEEAPLLETLPFIVVIIDELADMMMVVGKKVEELIARLAQKARASGIHLILATQRPSVDVLTGLIKANVPTRIAFQVSSKIDSRTILDQMGAESLLGNGDMLYQPPGTSIPVRVHGAFVDDHEVHNVVNDLRRRGGANYNEEILAGDTGGETIPGESYQGEDAGDALYDEAVFFVTQSRKASISSVQRRLKVGYNRAANLVEEMERSGVISPPQSNGNREVLAPPPPED